MSEIHFKRGTTQVVDGLKMVYGVNDPKDEMPSIGPAGYRFEHRIRIHASPKKIWDVLMDVNRWGQWTILYPEASGEIKKDGTFNLSIKVPGTPASEAIAKVYEFEPEKKLMFDSIKGDVDKFNGMRYIQIEQVSDNECIVTDGEVVGGKFGVPLAKMMPHNLFRGLQYMNEGLKKEAEK